MPDTARTAIKYAIWSVAILLLLIGDVVHAGDRIDRRTQDRDIASAYERGVSSADRKFRSKKIEITRIGHSVFLRGGMEQSAVELVCLLCTESEVLSKARELGVVAAAKHQGKEPALFSVSGFGDDGMLLVDGIPMVPPGKIHPIEPGKHEIILVYDGRTKKTSRNIAPEQQVAVDADLAVAPTPKRTYAGLQVLLGGLGLTAAVIGGVFLWLDGNCADANCKYVHDLKPAGATLVSMGIAAEIGLLLWLFLPRGKTESSVESQE